MGKEAKIGMAVIGALALTFAIVLATRLIGSKDEAPPASQAGEADASDDPTAQSGSSSGAPAPLPKPTVLTEARPGPGSLAGSGGSSRWTTASDSGGSPSGAPTTMPSSSPSQGFPGVGRSDAYPSPPPAISQPDSASGDPFLRQAQRSRPGAYDLSAPSAAPSPVAPSGPYGSADAPYLPDQRPGGGGDAPYSFRAQGGGAGSSGSPYATDRSPPGSSSRPAPDTSGYQTIPPAPKAGSYDQGTNGSTDPYRAGTSSLTSSGGPSFDARGEGRRADGTYVVQPNESFWTISERLYGTGAYFKALAQHNRAALDDRGLLPVGRTIQAPDQADLEQKYPELCPSPERRDTIRQRGTLASTPSPYARGRAYTVQEGDSLYDIARFELGKGSRWTEIYELNKDVLRDDFDYLTPGMKLLLPEDSRDAVTRRPQAKNPY